MDRLRYTLVTEGSSDIALIPILNWLLRENGVKRAIQGEWADLGETRIAERISLIIKIREGIRLYPCDILFVHRDADGFAREKRLDEINEAVVLVKKELGIEIPPAVCVIPVRMQEAWLLFDETAIRYAAGNRNGHILLNLPLLRHLESVPDPKSVLHENLKLASGLTGRRIKRFRISQHARRVSEFIDDFSPLRVLTAFAALEADVKRVIEEQGWKG